MTEKPPPPKNIKEEAVPNTRKEKAPKVNPYLELEKEFERIKTCELGDIPFTLSESNEKFRTTILERVVTEEDSQWASEALTIDQNFSPEELEKLLALITDPFLSCEVLTHSDRFGRQLTEEQVEKLISHIESDEDVAHYLYSQLGDAGLLGEPSDAEKIWIPRLEKILSQTENSEYATYLLENGTTLETLSDEERERLEKIAQ